MAMDVEWYSKPVSLEIKSIVYRIWKGMIDKLFKSYHLGIKWKKRSGMQLVFKRAIDVERHSKTALYWESVMCDTNSIQLGLKEYIDINWFLHKERNRNHWQVISIEIPQLKDFLYWRNNWSGMTLYLYIWTSINGLQIKWIPYSFSIQLGIKEYIDINWFLIQKQNRNHW
jgi:hypothetical protein